MNNEKSSEMANMGQLDTDYFKVGRKYHFINADATYKIVDIDLKEEEVTILWTDHEEFPDSVGSRDSYPFNHFNKHLNRWLKYKDTPLWNKLEGVTDE